MIGFAFSLSNTAHSFSPSLTSLFLWLNLPNLSWWYFIVFYVVVFVRFIPWCLIWFDGIVNSILKIMFSNCSCNIKTRLVFVLLQCLYCSCILIIAPVFRLFWIVCVYSHLQVYLQMKLLFYPFLSYIFFFLPNCCLGCSFTVNWSGMSLT